MPVFTSCSARIPSPPDSQHQLLQTEAIMPKASQQSAKYSYAPGVVCPPPPQCWTLVSSHPGSDLTCRRSNEVNIHNLTRHLCQETRQAAFGLCFCEAGDRGKPGNAEHVRAFGVLGGCSVLDNRVRTNMYENIRENQAWRAPPWLQQLSPSSVYWCWS